MWQLLLLKAMPLIVTLLLTGFLPSVLRRRTHGLAVKSLLLDKEETPADKESHETMDYLLNWRDLITAVVTGLFVLEFSVAEKVTEKITAIHPVTSGQSVAWAIVVVIAMIFLIPLFLVAAWYLTNKLELNPMQSKLKYWLLFTFFVVPLYVVSFFLGFL